MMDFDCKSLMGHYPFISSFIGAEQRKARPRILLRAPGFGQHRPHGIEVWIGDQAAAAFAAVAVAGADGVATGAYDRPQTRLAAVEQADVLAQLALDAQGVVGQLRLPALQQWPVARTNSSRSMGQPGRTASTGSPR